MKNLFQKGHKKYPRREKTNDVQNEDAEHEEHHTDDEGTIERVPKDVTKRSKEIIGRLRPIKGRDEKIIEGAKQNAEVRYARGNRIVDLDKLKLLMNKATRLHNEYKCTSVNSDFPSPGEKRKDLGTKLTHMQKLQIPTR